MTDSNPSSDLRERLDLLVDTDPLVLRDEALHLLSRAEGAEEDLTRAEDRYKSIAEGLQVELRDMIRALRHAERQRDDALIGLRQVRRLHDRYRFAGDDTTDYCIECNRLSGGWEPYPCRTVKAIDLVTTSHELVSREQVAALQAAAIGLPQDRAAQRLGISERTHRRLLAAAADALGAGGGHVHAVAIAAALGLIPLTALRHRTLPEPIKESAPEPDAPDADTHTEL